MVTQFKTKNSVYEINQEAKQIRRISGTNPPTSRQAPDGVWQEYESCSDIQMETRVLVVWTTGKGTVLSQVTEILYCDEELSEDEHERHLFLGGHSVGEA